MRTQLLEALQNDFCELQGCKCKTLEPVGSASTWRAELSDGRSLFLKLASPGQVKWLACQELGDGSMAGAA